VGLFEVVGLLKRVERRAGDSRDVPVKSSGKIEAVLGELERVHGASRQDLNLGTVGDLNARARREQEEVGDGWRYSCCWCPPRWRCVGVQEARGE